VKHPTYNYENLLSEEEKRHKEHQGQVGTLQAQSLTYCKKEMEKSVAARRSALCKHNHLHPIERQWQDEH
jgi:hypothetical protein